MVLQGVAGCVPGYTIDVVNDAKTSPCSACPVQTFKSDIGEGHCSACLANSYSSAGSAECQCNAGFAKETHGTCAICAKGTYKAHAGNKACNHCSPGKYYDSAATPDCSVDDCIGQNLYIVEQDSNTRRSTFTTPAVIEQVLASTFIRTAEMYSGRVVWQSSAN